MLTGQQRGLKRNKILDSAYVALFDRSSEEYNLSLRYSGRFKDYNANVSYRGRNYLFSLSSEWKGVSLDIVIGVIQHLMLKAFSGANYKMTLNIELYNDFLKQIHKYKVKTKIDPFLKIVFDRVNLKYFSGLIEMTNLEWGAKSIRTLGHYSYGSDTITISRIFEGVSLDDIELLDFVMYHEMLHKKHKFTSSSTGRNLHHSSAFRRDEKRFSNYSFVERRLGEFSGSKRSVRKKRVVCKKVRKFSWF